MPPARHQGRHEPALSFGWPVDWQRDKHSAASPHRILQSLWPTRSRCLRACPWVRWRARWHRCGSLEQLADGTGAAFRVRGGPFQGHDLLTERQLDSYGAIGGRPERYECRQSCRRPLSVKRYLFANDVGIDAVADGDTGNGCARLQAFLNDLGFERFRIRASLAHGNPGDKGDRVRLKIRGHHRP
mgnify:CR=1 FL=1